MRLVIVVFAALILFLFPKNICKTELSLKEPFELAIAKIEVIATAYYKPLKKQSFYSTGSYESEIALNGSGITYSGEKATKGVIAADLRIFPLNTIVYIPEYGYGVVKDIGGKIRGKRIDVFMGEGEVGLKKAMAWGKKRIKIYVLKWGDI
jgi:3D (Asp-Asp-Asp) domain-containing protein